VVASRAGPALQVFKGTIDPPNQWLEIALRGVREEGKMRTNTGGIGAVISVTSGRLTQWREIGTASSVLGGPAPIAHFGLGHRPEADFARIVWPDDVIQSEPNLSAGQRKVITQVYRKGSSCPLLFAWDGNRFAFVTDFLGKGGLGFFFKPGVYAPPDPVELVSIPSLEPKVGAYELRIHEAMEEVVYLDLARLLVVDHPEGTEIWPDERLATGLPPQTGRLLVIRTEARSFPRSLWTADGPADAGCLTASDRLYQPGVRPDRRFLGYAAPQEIVLDFGDALLTRASTRPLYLFLEGWVEYPYSHVNFAAWQAGLRMEPLSLDIETAPDTWETVLAEFGYPAGLSRLMAVDVSAIPSSGTGRLRLRTNLEIFIDRAFIGEDLGLVGIEVRELMPALAELRPSGYPREYSPDGREPLLYDYALMDSAIDFKTMGGDHTRFGDVTELLAASDDRYVILGRAEEIVLRFPALDPPRAGRRRSFILRSDGWCKDMDLYTAFPHHVEPLPFHGMSGYPYPPSESYPSDAFHTEYRRIWNTRHLAGSRGSGPGR
jgi:hypothetical protein